jgi:hypothetical protein
MAVSWIDESFTPQADEMEGVVQRRLGTRVRDFRMLVRPNGVILLGRASTYHAKQLAQHATMELVPLPILANHIEVQ